MSTTTMNPVPVQATAFPPKNESSYPTIDFGPRQKFSSLVRIELRKMVDTRSGRWLLIAILARGWGSVFTVGLTIASIVYGPMLGAFLLGVLTRRANERGVMAGIGVSLVSMILVRVFTPLAWTWYVLAGTAICMGVALVVSRAGR